jgi:exodeoxyribonuclease III
MIRIITLNVNGLRAAAKKGFFTWMANQQADIVCLQETKAQEHQLDPTWHPPGWQCYCFDAKKLGYSGVAIYTRHTPSRIIKGLGWIVADEEGRYIQLDFGRLSVASVYMPSGSSSAHRQACKFDFLNRYQTILKQQLQEDREYILCGDWNIAHQPIDLKNWRANQKNSGFLPEERAWLDKVFYQLGYLDAFRYLNPASEQYTWWSHRGRAWEKNVGWRIDYQIVSPQLKSTLASTTIYKQQRFSDHAPLIINYDISI